MARDPRHAIMSGNTVVIGIRRIAGFAAPPSRRMPRRP
jgi:hypothetical protein